jgi:hypothetical protein
MGGAVMCVSPRAALPTNASTIMPIRATMNLRSALERERTAADGEGGSVALSDCDRCGGSLALKVCTRGIS